MSSWAYLDAYLSSIPAAQRQDLLNLVYSDVQSQTIQTVSDYEAQLASQLAAIQGGISAPIFTLRTAPFRGLTNSFNFNDMEVSAINALKIIYQEALLLESAISNHTNLVAGKLDAIEATVASLEKQVDTLELLASNANGYVSSVYDSFSEQNTYRLNRADISSTTPFIISDIGFIPSTNDAQVLNQALQLPITNNISFRITAAYIQGQNPPSSAVTASSEDIPTEENAFSIATLLDNDPTKYWAETVDIQTLSTNKAETDVVLQVAGTQQINNIFLNPFTRFPYRITSIQYTKNINTGVYYEMLDDISQYPITVGAPINIQFSSKYADSIKIHIVQQNYSSLRYVAHGSSNTITQIFDNATGQAVPSSELTDPNNYYFAMTGIMQDLLNIEKTKLTDTNVVDVYEFLYGIKTITIGQLQYSNPGIYVSKGYTIPLAGAIGLNVDEFISDPTLSSVEYDVLVQYNDIVNGNPVFVSSLASNILPEEVSTIEGEVLDGTNDTVNSKWVATTRFGVTDLATIQVFQNNIVLDPMFYTISQDSTTKIVTVTIHDVTISVAQRNISFYTINYKPVSTSYVVNLDRHDEAVINLRMLLRSVSPNKMLSPLVKSYSMKFKRFV